MLVPIDKAGRIVVPKALREAVGIVPGVVDMSVDGASIRLEPVSGAGLLERGRRLVIPPSGNALTDEQVRALRDADQR